jgi:hypothetical protein
MVSAYRFLAESLAPVRWIVAAVFRGSHRQERCPSSRLVLVEHRSWSRGTGAGARTRTDVTGAKTWIRGLSRPPVSPPPGERWPAMPEMCWRQDRGRPRWFGSGRSLSRLRREVAFRPRAAAGYRAGLRRARVRHRPLRLQPKRRCSVHRHPSYAIPNRW